MRARLADMLRAVADRLDPPLSTMKLKASLERFGRQMDLARALQDRRDSACVATVATAIAAGALDQVMADRFALSPVNAAEKTNGGGDARD